MTMPSNKWEEACREIIWYELGDGLNATDVNECVATLTNAVRELVETAKPENPNEYRQDDHVASFDRGYNSGTDTYQANLLKAIGDE